MLLKLHDLGSLNILDKCDVNGFEPIATFRPTDESVKLACLKQGTTKQYIVVVFLFYLGLSQKLHFHF